MRYSRFSWRRNRSLSGPAQQRGRKPQVPGARPARTPVGVPAVRRGRLEGQSPRRMDRMDGGATRMCAPPVGQQYTLSRPVLATRAASGQSSAGACGLSARRRLACQIWTRHRVAGNVRGSRAVSGNLLSVRGLGSCGRHARAPTLVHRARNRTPKRTQHPNDHVPPPSLSLPRPLYTLSTPPPAAIMRMAAFYRNVGAAGATLKIRIAGARGLCRADDSRYDTMHRTTQLQLVADRR